ncbi:quinon protein alcohol dehydrogenase-like superfamily [Gloeopeniophorella convolvens]|nr:quinon protein alcohol dehydrogenase-like superfamily [Gloeopeniophorella convolvens]
MAEEYIWTPPAFNVSKDPTLIHTTHLLPDPDFPENFARSAKWCPDGSLALAHCENRSLQYLDLTPHSPQDLLDLTLSQSARALPQAASILDYAWYPRATPRDPASFCLVASVRDAPVRLLDATDGRLRASYRIVDHRERHVAPHSLAFNVSAERLYCGFEGAIEVFDLARPGEGTRLLTTPSRKSKDGLKGIIAALAFCPAYGAGAGERLFAAGSLAPSSSSAANVALFDEDTGARPVAWVGDVRAGVVQLAFNPARPNLLYASFRRRAGVCCWDLRGSTVEPLRTYGSGDGARCGTNQKMRFDVDLAGNWLGVGDEKGGISVFSLADDAAASGADVMPALQYNAHDDAVGSVVFHPLDSLMVSVSGSRHFDHAGDSGSEGDDGADGAAGPVTRTGGAYVRRRRERLQPVSQDSSVRLWRFAGAETT